MEEADAAGTHTFPRKSAIVRPQRSGIEWRVNFTQLAREDGHAINGIEPDDLTRGEIEGRKQAVAAFEFLRTVPGFEKSYIVDLPPQLGIRETRRIIGGYHAQRRGRARLRLVRGFHRRQWLADRGPCSPATSSSSSRRSRNRAAINELPYRMLVPEGIDNLLVAGRCASMTHEGQSAARVSGACFAMGEAAGTAAALALVGNTIPRDIAVEKLQQTVETTGRLHRAGPGRARRPVTDCTNDEERRRRKRNDRDCAARAGGPVGDDGDAASARAEDALKAKIGVLRLSSSAPVFIAQDKGYFREAGLDVELKFFDAAQPIAVATTSGDVDFGVTAFTAGLYNLAGKGTLKVIGGMSREKAGYPLIGYFASNNAYAAGLKTPKDLAGKRIAVTQVGSSFHYSLGLLADKYGFKLADVKVLPLQSLSNAAAALKGETVDAALLPVSTARKLMDDGGAKFLGWVGDETPWQLGAVFASPKTLTNKALVTKLLGALARADREYHDVILASMKDGKAPINDKTKPLLEIIAKYTNLPVEQVVGNCAYIDPDGKLDVKNVDNQIEWLQEQGFVDKGFDADRSRSSQGLCEGGLRVERSHGPDRRPYQPPLRRARRARRRLVHGRLGRGGGDRRAVRLRQEHAAVDPRRAAAAELGRGRTARRAAGGQPQSADLRVPGFCAAAVVHGGGECRIPAAAYRAWPQRAPRRGRRRAAPHRACPIFAAPIRSNFPAACASASALPARWRCGRRSC